MEGAKLLESGIKITRAVVAAAGRQSGVLTSGLDGCAMHLVTGREC